MTLIKKHYWDKTKTVKYQTTDGSEVSHRTCSFEAKLKDCDIPIKFVVIFGKWNKDDDNTYHILITNQLTASAKTVITNYLLRWGIDHCFKELKDTFYFGHYQVRHIEKIERYWNLCLIAWTLTYWIKQNAYLNKVLEHNPTTFNEFKCAINTIQTLMMLRHYIVYSSKMNTTTSCASNFICRSSINSLLEFSSTSELSKNLPISILKLNRTVLKRN